MTWAEIWFTIALLFVGLGLEFAIDVWRERVKHQRFLRQEAAKRFPELSTLTEGWRASTNGSH